MPDEPPAAEPRTTVPERADGADAPSPSPIAADDRPAVEQLPLAERAEAYGQRLEQLRRALDDPDEPLDFPEEPGYPDMPATTDRSDTPDMPDTPDRSDTLDTSDTSDTPDEPETADEPEVAVEPRDAPETGQ